MRYYVSKGINDFDIDCDPENGRAVYRVAGYIESRELAERMAAALNSSTSVSEQHTRSRLGKPVHRSKSTARPEYRRHKAEKALAALLTALHEAREAGAPYTVERIKLALSSARGAVRNAGYRVTAARRRG